MPFIVIFKPLYMFVFVLIFIVVLLVGFGWYNMLPKSNKKRANQSSKSWLHDNMDDIDDNFRGFVKP
jgi:cbb3-type cytochrome oxidase subunit 3